MSDTEHAHVKYAPSLSQIISAAKRLPDPSKEKERWFETYLEGEAGREIKFERIKMVKSDGTKIAKWSYDGRVIVDAKFVGGGE